MVIKGAAQLLGVVDNFYGITPPEMPKGWRVDFGTGEVSRKAQIHIDYKGRTASVELDKTIFDNKDVPDGCKIFIIFHEIGHLLFGPAEELCDEFAFWHALRAGVSPFLCYVAIRSYMPDHYAYRVERLGQLLAANPQLKNIVDNG